MPAMQISSKGRYLNLKVINMTVIEKRFDMYLFLNLADKFV